MAKNKQPESSKDSWSTEEIKSALKHATEKDLLNEVFRRCLFGPVTSLERWPDRAVLDEMTRRGLLLKSLRKSNGQASNNTQDSGTASLQDLRERLRGQPVKRDPGSIDEEIAAMKARAAKHYEYVGQLLEHRSSNS